ncbi:hypothetical protein P170DRAFT_439110 [Aspergillus steynii IBT 23096]|uniref:Receptor L-domain domain-containing protein n=1 Tax=Aspergillus steynii IBT 23096 TaxID=1392250 RepID=A0A2I2G3J8_9EURO|nr:uncharacterized protein P170DRAFT_439110 [Aspergillus steynii IBT 23096]PLB47455.1 hypothetical protein P170DRAFT_439110 [Aspergillus steynii IBT 23096]
MRLWLALALVTLLNFAAGQECHRNFTITPNDNTTKLFQSCTTIVGDINIRTSIDGELYLRGVYNVTGNIDFRPDSDANTDSRPVVHFFIAPDLFYLGGLNVHQGFSVYELYLRDLETVGNISVYVDEYALNLDLGSLVEANSINISRALSTVDLDDLKTVHGALTIDYHAANDSSNEPTSSNYGRIDFPSLESAGSLNLAGATKNITLPRLTSVGPSPGSGSESGLTLHMDKLEKPINLDLPRLGSVEDHLKLYGNVKEIHAPRLTNFTSMNITSTTNLDCDSFLSIIEQSSQYPDNGSSVTCTFTPSKGLSKGAKIAIGVVVPVVVIAIVVGILLMWMKKKSRRESRARMGLSRLDLAGTEREARSATPPPPYSSHGAR